MRGADDFIIRPATRAEFDIVVGWAADEGWNPGLGDAGLFRALAGAAPDGPVYLDTPEPNKEALALARRYAMTPCFETARMYTGPAPDLPLVRTYGVTSFELG